MEKIKVLIADEHPAFREGVRQAVDGAGDMEVVAITGDGESAVELAVETKPDVAVIGVTLPRKDGIATTKKLKEDNPEIGVILVSPYSHGSFIMPALRAGALGYLTKTSPLEELLNCIRSVKAREIVVDSRAVGKLLRLMVDESNEKSEYVEKLHLREMEVLGLIAKGLRNQDIAANLGISDHTVHTHLNNIFRKLGVKSRTEALIQALKMGWISFDELA
jgi:DNA-binding NarL/FixJ family response regulator